MKKNNKKTYPKQGRRVFVAMSGGVDSSVAAALLQKATPNNFEKLFGRPTPRGFRGYDVVGVHMRCWSPSASSGQVPGCNEVDAEDARRVAEKLNIPFYVFDFEKEYKAKVVDYMIDGYKSGITPNPDVMCNKEIKFGLFLDKALEMGADFIATGHYVRIRRSSPMGTVVLALQRREPTYVSLRRPRPTCIKNEWRGPSSSRSDICPTENSGGYSLMSGRDLNKDQSYFLWTLTQEQLRHCLFPIGDYFKSDVRKLAKKFGLPTAEKKDSQGICFVGKVTLVDFLKDYIPKKRGNVLNMTGEKIGEHRGAHFYTIGQRHGLASGNWKRNNNGKDSKPFFVVEKNVKKNILVVSDQEGGDFNQKEIRLKNINLIIPKSGIRNQELGISIVVRLRYRQPLVKAKLLPNGDTLKIILDKPQKFIAPGQSAVFYDKEGVMLGGGIIV